MLLRNEFEDVRFYLAGLLNNTNTQSSVRKLVIDGRFREYTASNRDSRYAQLIVQLEIKGTKMEDHILLRLSPQFTNLESLKLVSCFTKFEKDNIAIDMPSTAIGTLTLSDSSYLEKEEDPYYTQHKIPKFNATVLMVITSGAADNQTTRYFISLDPATSNDATKEIIKMNLMAL